MNDMRDLLVFRWNLHVVAKDYCQDIIVARCYIKLLVFKGDKHICREIIGGEYLLFVVPVCFHAYKAGTSLRTAESMFFTDVADLLMPVGKASLMCYFELWQSDDGLHLHDDAFHCQGMKIHTPLHYKSGVTAQTLKLFSAFLSIV